MYVIDLELLRYVLLSGFAVNIFNEIRYIAFSLYCRKFVSTSFALIYVIVNVCSVLAHLVVIYVAVNMDSVLACLVVTGNVGSCLVTPCPSGVYVGCVTLQGQRGMRNIWGRDLRGVVSRTRLMLYHI